MRSELKRELSTPKRAYLERGALPKAQALVRFFLRREHIRYLSSHHQGPLDFDRFYRERYLPLRDQVSVRYQVLRRDDPSVERLSALKSAFFGSLGSYIKYNARHASALSPLITHRIQCRSATRLLAAIAIDLVDAALIKDLTDSGSLVIIFSDTHERLGWVNQRGQVQAIEMTSWEGGLTSYGDLKELRAPLRIVQANHVLIQSAILASPRDLRERGGLLYDQVYDQVSDQVSESFGSSSRFNPSGRDLSEVESHQLRNKPEPHDPFESYEPFAFSSGKRSVAEGDLELSGAYPEYLSRSLRYQPITPSVSTLETSSVHSGHRLFSNDKSSIISISQLKASDQRIIYKYQSHLDYLEQLHNQHIRLIVSELPPSAKITRSKLIVKELNIYWRKSQLSELKSDAYAVLRGVSEVASLSADPAKIYNIIVHNHRVLMLKKGEMNRDKRASYKP